VLDARSCPREITASAIGMLSLSPTGARLSAKSVTKRYSAENCTRFAHGEDVRLLKRNSTSQPYCCIDVSILPSALDADHAALTVDVDLVECSQRIGVRPECVGVLAVDGIYVNVLCNLIEVGGEGEPLL
jgi:hypothetical protein